MKTSMNRRTFLHVASTAGAGLAVTLSLPWAGPACAQLPDAPFAPNAWLRIDADGTVTILVAKSEMGQGIRTALPMIVAEELDADWARVRVEQAVADKKYGNMGTGGSTSIRTSWDRLRTAGATARAMLISAAAKTWGVAEGACTTERGRVMHTATGRTLTYGELAARASTLPVPAKVALKDPKDFSIIGKRIPRLDIPSKTDGSAVFGIDIRRPRMLYASISRCPVFGGKPRAFSTTAALAVPGVRIVTAVDSGVAVIADSTWAAFRGREALQITWDNGPHNELSSEKIHAMFVEAARKPGAIAAHEGDPEAALARASKVIRAVYEVPFLAHATMEPMNCVADVHPDRCEIWASTQDPQGFQARAAELLGLSAEKIVVHTTYLGGGFGRRFESDFLADAVQCSRAAEAPVKVTWTREDDMTHDFYRPASYHVLAGGLDAEGNLLALTHRVVAPSISGQYNPEGLKNGLDTSAVEGAVALPYTIPNMRVEYVVANTAVPVGYWRSVYPSQNVFATESFLDELAHAAGKDPLAFRRALITNRPRVRRVLDLAAERAGWGAPLPPGHALGIALSPPAFFRTPVAQVAEVSLDGKGAIRVHRVVASIDCGIAINPDGIAAQMEGGVIFGLTAALHGKISLEHGRVDQTNFDTYSLVTIDRAPVVDTVIVPSTEPPSGTGEPGLPAIAPAVANALFRLTGKRFRQLPLQAL